MTTARSCCSKYIKPFALCLALLALAGILRGLDTERDTAKEFTLVYNINNAGYIDVCGCKHKEVRQGSITRRASFLKQLQATGRDLLLLDGGSAFFPINKRLKATEVPDAVRKAELITEAYNRMGYSAMAIGPYDIITGLENLQKLKKKARFKMLSANFVGKDGKLLFEPHAIFEVAGVRVGVIGLTLETIPRPVLEKRAPGCKILDPFAAAVKSYELLKPKTDMIIALSHLTEDSNLKLIKNLKNLEIMIDPYIQQGNHKTWLKEESEWLEEKDDTLFLRSDGQGARLGVVDVELLKDGTALYSGDRYDELADLVEYDEADEAEKKELQAIRLENLYRFTRVSLEPHHLTDPEIDSLVDAWKKKTSLSGVKEQESNLSEKANYLTHTACKSCHEKQYAFWLTTTHSNTMDKLEKTGDESRYDCIGCHTLGYGQAFLDTTSIGKYANVQCESCHGLQPRHPRKPAEHAFGKITRKACIVCHNKEQTRSEFHFAPSRKKVACPKG